MDAGAPTPRRRRVEPGEEQDVIELVPNIILNPGFAEPPRRPLVRAGRPGPGPGKPRRV